MIMQAEFLNLAGHCTRHVAFTVFDMDFTTQYVVYADVNMFGITS